LDARPAINTVSSVELNGFTIVPDVLDSATIRQLSAALQLEDNSNSVRTRVDVYAIRNLLDLVSEVRTLADSPVIRSLVAPFLGEGAFPVRGVYFDKTIETNWKVAWHQDLSIAVQEKIDVAGFGPWSIKAEVVHVQPPIEILEGLLALRIHLDACSELNGALRVIPGSHLQGRLNSGQIQSYRQKANEVTCCVGPGGVLMMRPLLLHNSSASTKPECHRRVIHIEFSGQQLPGGLRWL
jgi:ectoine hydroxylase-related dioxygenase (phytanoyl-CoA dioxygenase family)